MFRHITSAVLFCFGWMLAFTYVVTVWVKGMHLEMKAEFAFTTRSIFVAMVELSVFIGGLFLLALSVFALFDIKDGPISPGAARLFWGSVAVVVAMFSVWIYLYE